MQWRFDSLLKIKWLSCQVRSLKQTEIIISNDKIKNIRQYRFMNNKCIIVSEGEKTKTDRTLQTFPHRRNYISVKISPTKTCSAKKSVYLSIYCIYQWNYKVFLTDIPSCVVFFTCKQIHFSFVFFSSSLSFSRKLNTSCTLLSFSTFCQADIFILTATFSASSVCQTIYVDE